MVQALVKSGMQKRKRPLSVSPTEDILYLIDMKGK
jgi:hypothetical protein